MIVRLLPPSSVAVASIVQRQYVTFPRLRCGFDSRYSHQVAKATAEDGQARGTSLILVSRTKIFS